MATRKKKAPAKRTSHEWSDEDHQWSDEDYAVSKDWSCDLKPNESHEGEFEIYVLVQVPGPDANDPKKILPERRVHIAWAPSYELARFIVLNQRTSVAATNLVGRYDRFITDLESSKEALAFEEAWGHSESTKRRIVSRRGTKG